MKEHFYSPGRTKKLQAEKTGESSKWIIANQRPDNSYEFHIVLKPKKNIYDFLTYEEAHEFVLSLKLKGQKEWRSYSKKGRPVNIPSAPWEVYKNRGWISLGEWLGTGNIATRRKEFLSFIEARTIAHSLKLKSKKEWYSYIKCGCKNIPAAPDSIYIDKGWVSWDDWLGTGNISFHRREFLPFKEARTFARSLKLKSRKEWYSYSKIGHRPKNIPSNSYRTYKNQGWIGWNDWLGKKE